MAVYGKPFSDRFYRHLWHRTAPSSARGAQPAADWQERAVESALDHWRQTVFCAQSPGSYRRLGCRHSQCLRWQRLQEITERNADQMVLFSDEGFVKRNWHPENVKICQRGKWNARMIVETVLSMLTPGVPFPEDDAPGLGLFPEPLGLHDGDVQPARPVGRHPRR